MATLHVRNVPDELYEELRASAEREGRSIGAQAVMLLRGALGERRRMLDEVEGTVIRRRSAFSQRFAERAKEIVERAQDICREVGSAEVTPAHVMLAMLEDDVLRPTFERKGVTEEAVRSVLPSGPPRQGPAHVSAETRRMLERALLSTLE